jgi:hemolysin III
LLDLRDPISSASHLFTAAWAVFATLIMWRLTRNRPDRAIPVVVFGLSMVLLFLASGIFHALNYETPEQRRFFQQLDQSAVYILIAGSGTPAVAILLQGAWRKWFLRLVWLLAFVGVACMWLLPKFPHSAIVGIYIGLGCVAVIPVRCYHRAIGWWPLNWVWVGGSFYVLGAICELTQWPVIVPGWLQAHEVLHLCDVVASLAFFVFVVRHVIPYNPANTRVIPAKAAA